MAGRSNMIEQEGQATDRRTVEDNTGQEGIPTYTHEYVLGADIGVSQRDTMTHEYRGHKTRESSVEVEAYQGKLRQQRQRRYLTAWARRSLFTNNG